MIPGFDNLAKQSNNHLLKNMCGVYVYKVQLGHVLFGGNLKWLKYDMNHKTQVIHKLGRSKHLPENINCATTRIAAIPHYRIPVISS